MKTYQQLRTEILEKFDLGLLDGPITYGKIEEMVDELILILEQAKE